MARGKSVELATRTFANQKLATEFFKDMLRRYKPGHTIGADDSLDLSALLERHPEYQQKVGCGVDHYEIMMTDHGTPCFRIVREDGTGTDFSYYSCITRHPPSRKQEVCHAFRRSIRTDLFEARDKFFAEHKGTDGLVSCAVSGERLSRDQGHMDHRPPMTFEVIVTTFLQYRGLGFDNVSITTGQDEQVSPEIMDDDLVADFRTSHSRVARLDFVKDTINLAQSAKHRLKPARIKLAAS